jgi:hypothetical protein
METLIYHLKFCTEKEGRGCSVGVVNRLRDWMTGELWFVAGAKGFPLLQNIQTASGVHPASYSLGIGASFPAVKQPRPEPACSPPFRSHAFMVLIGTTILMSLPSINMFCSFSLFIEPAVMADSQNKCLSLPQKRTCCSRGKRIWSRDHVVNDSVIYKIFGSLVFEVSPCR